MANLVLPFQPGHMLTYDVMKHFFHCDLEMVKVSEKWRPVKSERTHHPDGCPKGNASEEHVMYLQRLQLPFPCTPVDKNVRLANEASTRLKSRRT